jgi:hypothetical protein
MATSPRRATPSTRRAALYVRVSTADRGQIVENQLQLLYEAARSGTRATQGEPAPHQRAQALLDTCGTTRLIACATVASVLRRSVVPVGLSAAAPQ